MQSTIGVYDNHEKALEAVIELKKAGFTESHISIIGQAEVVDNHLHVKSKENLKVAGVTIGAVLGPIVGVLAGLGLVAIPGLGLIYGAGAIAGALAGFDVGVIGGGLVSILTILGVKEDNVVKYKEQLAQGHYLLSVQGTSDEVNRARKILEANDTHLALDVHGG